MKLRKWITAGVLCALCYAGVESSYAQKMYKQGNAIVLDCGPDSGFPQGAVEMQKGKKIAAGTPSDTQGPMADNKENQSINATVYHKLEIAYADALNKMSWTKAYTYCQQRGDGWRLPTQRELMLIWIFKDAVVGLNGNNFLSTGFWSSTEYNSSSSWYVDFTSGSAFYKIKTHNNNYRTRCVREL